LVLKVDVVMATMVIASLAGFVLSAPPAAGQPVSQPLTKPLTKQGPAYRAPRFAGSQNPDLNGIWQALNSANWDLEPHAAGPSPFPALLGAISAEPAGQGVVEGGKIPYQPWAAEKKKENFKNRLLPPIDRPSNETTGDPEAKCYLPGVPRATYMPYPIRLVQAPKQILLVYEFASATRIVYMDRKPKIPNDAWMGWSMGRWEGDTLVIDVTEQNDRTWFDRAGNFHSAAMHVVERYTPSSPYHLMYEATIEDPKVFTRPWTIRMPLYRRIEPNMQLLEFKCVEFSEEFIYGHLIEKPAQ
jgi:hypothetical protein